MPLGIERINARRKQPNDRINFIKPLKGPDEALSEDFLERIAAIVNPIMQKNRIAVMSLEEYEPNTEFLGRNFNAGEVIQLVLKTRSGHWLPFRYVQMVMIHELSHCKQMNHSAAFWQIRNDYVTELKVLWQNGYTGEGLWSRGITLASGNPLNETIGNEEVLPEHLCGGTYQSSRKRKRKHTDNVSYKERQARRIANKFGTNGVSLGADEERKIRLEKGKKTVSKPRVAGSARGRELRAAAALARFGDRKDSSLTREEEDETESDTESDEDYDSTIKPEPSEAVDIDGEKMFDIKGRAMVKVCEDDNKDDLDAQIEMSELESSKTVKQKSSTSMSALAEDVGVSQDPDLEIIVASTFRMSGVQCVKNNTSDGTILTNSLSLAQPVRHPDGKKTIKDQNLKLGAANGSSSKALVPELSCPLCSMGNEPGNSICAMCSNVLDPRLSNTWLCKSDMCLGSRYVNAGDFGVCGICGARKCS